MTEKLQFSISLRLSIDENAGEYNRSGLKLLLPFLYRHECSSFYTGMDSLLVYIVPYFKSELVDVVLKLIHITSRNMKMQYRMFHTSIF